MQCLSFKKSPNTLLVMLFSLVFYHIWPFQQVLTVSRSVLQPVRRPWRTQMWWIWEPFVREWSASSSSWTAASREPFLTHPSLLLLWTWCVLFECFDSLKARAVHHHDIRGHRCGSGSIQEAPVVARASLFLECARFVHRCNRGNWPEWMKGHHVNITKRGLSRGRSPIVGNKRNQKLQWNAAKHFCQWGDVS